jgi:hypothetical protein
MAGNLSIALTVDTTDVISKLAIAQAEIKKYGAAVRATAAEIVASGEATAAQVAALDKANAGLRAAQAAQASLRSETLQGAAATKTETAAVNEATGAAHGNRAATEAMVLVHEAMSGRFTKMGGSLMILTQQLGGTSLAMMGLTGAFAVAAMGAMHLVEWLDKVHESKLLAEAGALGSGLTPAQADQAVTALRSLSGVSTEEAGKIANAYLQMAGVTGPVLTELTKVTHELALRMGEDNTAAAQKIVAAYSMDANAATELMQKTRASAEATSALQTAITNNDPIAARTILLRELARSAAQVDTETRLAARTTSEMNASMAAARAANMPAGSAAGALLKTPVVDTAEVQRAQSLQAALAAVNAEMKAPAALSWSDQMRTALSEATLATVEAGRKQNESWQQISQDRLKTEVQFWQKAVQTTRDGSKEQEEARRLLYQAEEQLDMMSQKQGAVAAKQSLEEKLAELSAEQSAEHVNFAAVMALEQQKLNLLKAAGSSYTRQYQEELKHQEDMQREHNEELQRIDLDHIVKTESIDREALATKKSDLAVELSDHLITKQEELSQLQTFVEQQYEAEHAALQNYLDTNTLEVGARQKALDDMAALEQQHAKEVAALNAQMAQANRQTAQANEREWQQAFSSIGSAGERAVTGLVTGTETFRRAELQVANSVVESAMSLGSKLVEQWAATELAKSFATDSGVAQRVAAEQAEGNTGLGTILARWVGLETAKTSATTAGATTRAAADSGGGFLSEISGILTKWLGLETAKTAATDAGATTRATAESATAAAGTATVAAAARADIAAAAAVAASWAFADSAALGPPGLAAAPGAAAGAEASVMAFQAAVPALAVGAWNVPGDMLAQIHEGEMVVPQTFAEGMRSAASAGGTSAGTAGGEGGAGGTSVSISLSAIDTQSGIAFLRSNSAAIARMIATQVSRNPSLRPTF